MKTLKPISAEIGHAHPSPQIFPGWLYCPTEGLVDRKTLR